MSISQDTFDAAVKENVEEFGMDYSEAIEDAIKQFAAQGVSLTHIITDKNEDGSHPIPNKTEELKSLISNNSIQDSEKAVNLLSELQTECGKGMAYQLMAAKAGLYDVLVSVLTSSANDLIMVQCLKTLTALSSGYPDILSESGAASIHNTMKENVQSHELSHTLLMLLRNFCIKHEGNRKMLMLDIQIAGTIVEIMNKHSNSLEVIVEVCKLLRSILSDDDIRVEFGQVQAYAKLLVEEHKVIALAAELLKEHSCSTDGVSNLISTLTKLAIRNEFCQEIVDHGALTLTLETLATHADDRASVESALGLIKALAGNDDVKHEIGKIGGIPAVVMAMQRHQAVSSVSEVGCSALGALALRHPQNAKLICEASGHMVLVDCLKIHATKPSVIRSAARAIRNMVSREKSLGTLFLEYGAEELLNDALKKYSQKCGDEVKAALRDLGCNVHLQELWVGQTNPVKRD